MNDFGVPPILGNPWVCSSMSEASHLEAAYIHRTMTSQSVGVRIGCCCFFLFQLPWTMNPKQNPTSSEVTPQATTIVHHVSWWFHCFFCSFRSQEPYGHKISPVSPDTKGLYKRTWGCPNHFALLLLVELKLQPLWWTCGPSDERFLFCVILWAAARLLHLADSWQNLVKSDKTSGPGQQRTANPLQRQHDSDSGWNNSSSAARSRRWLVAVSWCLPNAQVKSGSYSRDKLR